MLRVFLILLNGIFAVTCICPDEWLRYENSCYYFANRPSEYVTWNRAVQSCYSMFDSHLVIIETHAENEFIKRQFGRIKQDLSDQFWTFGNDIDRDGVWYWGTAPNRILTTFWRPGSPTELHYLNEECLSLFANSSLDDNWNDLHCHESAYYICEWTDFHIQSGSIFGRKK